MPNTPYAISLVNGDSGTPLVNEDTDEQLFAGKTYLEVFKLRLRINTFNEHDKPNHTFFAVLTDHQINRDTGKAWMKVFKEEGFEFLRTIDNSVYTGPALHKDGVHVASRKSHIFALFRNIGRGSIEDPYTPPKAWTDLPSPLNESGGETWEYLMKGLASVGLVGADLAKLTRNDHTKLWLKLPALKFYELSELLAEKIPVWLAGERSKNPQRKYNQSQQKAKASSSPWSKPVAAPALPDQQ